MCERLAGAATGVLRVQRGGQVQLKVKSECKGVRGVGVEAGHERHLCWEAQWPEVPRWGGAAGRGCFT